jgi:hypothetical protein
MPVGDTTVRSLLDDVLADTQDAGHVDVAERQRLKDESDTALARLHRAVDELARSQPELDGAARREPVSSR